MWRLFLCLLIGLVSLPAFAEQDEDLLLSFENSSSYYNEPYYKQEVRKVFSQRMNENFNFNDLRRYYVQTRHYEPMADHAKRKLSELSYLVINSSDRREVEEALEDFDTIIKAHLGNITVMTMAIALSKEDSRFGNPAFYRWITQGIMKVIKRQGNGESFETPYIIVTNREEELLLKALEVRPIKSELIPYGNKFYNIHTVIDPSKGKEPVEIFMDVSLPLNRAKVIHEAREKKLDLRP